MKKNILFLALFLLTLSVFAQETGVPGVQAPRIPTVGILPFEAQGEGVSAANAAEATRLVTAEMSSWGVMTVLTGGEANNGEYLIRGQISRQDNEIELVVTTSLRSTGRILNEVSERAASLGAISMVSFCAEVATNIPIPNFLLGRWQSTVDTPAGPMVTIMEFRTDRSILVYRYDTWERVGANSLRYQAFGTGSYTYAGYLRRTFNIENRQIQSDATVSIGLILEDALSFYDFVYEEGIRVLFNESRDSFELLAGGLPFGDDFDTSANTNQRLFYTQFSKIVSVPDMPEAHGSSSAFMQLGASPIWNLRMREIIQEPPHLQAESAVFAFTDGNVQSLHITGRQVWNFNSQESAIPVVARSVEGVTYVSNASGNFRAINRVGRELWRANFGRPVSFPPVVGWDGRLFIPLGATLVCRTAAGHPLWTIDLDSPMAMAPILDRAGSFVTVLGNLDFIRVNQFSTVERLTLQEQPSMIIPLKESELISYVLLYDSGRAEKITFDENASRGRRLSLNSFPALQAPPVAAAAATLSTGKPEQFAVTLRDGRVLLMNGQGQILWTANSHETTEERGSGNLVPGQASMVFDERGIYGISIRGATGFEDNGRRRFIHRFNDAGAVSAFCDSGILYVMGTDGILSVFNIDNRPRTIVHTRFYGPEPEGIYGLGNPPSSPWASDPRRFNLDVQDEMYDMILERVDAGQIGEFEPRYKAYLMEMIGFFVNDPHFSRIRPSVMPQRHIEFILLLGRIGSRETIPFLLSVFDRYHEPSVRSACAEAIGIIGVDPHGSAFTSYRFALAPNNPNRDPQLLLSTTSSVAALSRFSGPPLSGEGIVLLRYFSFLTWAPNAIRQHIRQVIDDLYSEGLDRSID